MKPARFDPGAEADLSEAVAWYEARCPGLGLEFADVVRAALQTISANPERWPRRTQNTRQYRLQRFPYAVVYLEQADAIWIVAVAHQSRKPSYWAERLR